MDIIDTCKDHWLAQLIDLDRSKHESHFKSGCLMTIIGG